MVTNFKFRRVEHVGFIGKDSSGTFFITSRKHEYIEAGNLISIDRCRIEEHKGKSQIAGLLESNITLVAKKDENRREDARDDRRGDDRRGERRGGGRRDEVREERRDERKV